MLFWNRKVVYHGFLVFEKGKISDILTANHIKHVARFVNKKSKYIMNHKNQLSYEGFALNLNYEKEFYIYVSKKDYYRALNLISSNG
ncbi:hypothetical protein EDD66_1157 [Mobilisporobacter senegalensis]|uniref:DUF2007 domain-containing protein n=1 Tax=Mobilisporobacter senegalensis TaxID=1329262 RepID=A0A3N1XBI6_9FIRM|nr:hypothetical protein [Mobilisporobacter senegalensis]ROR22322.1 hypothetical protein EDD66_1157 [Mobilisporobacter senegalensis]